MARNHDGATNVTEVADDPTLNSINDEITVAMWFRCTASAISFDGFLMKTSTSFWDDGFGLYHEGTDMHFFIDNYLNDGTFPLAANDFDLHNAVGVHNATDVQLWLDGSQGTDQPDATAFTASTNTLQIAKGRGVAPTVYTIPIIASYVAIWNTNIPVTHIGAINNGVHSFAILPDNLMMLLPLYGNINPELDESGNGNVGTVSGAVKTVNPPVQLIEEYI